MTTLKGAVQQPDGDAARAALKAALQDVLNHPHLVIKVAVLGTIVDREILSSSQKSMLQTAIDAVDALPDASNKKIQAEQIWNAAPKQDVLQTTAHAIQSGTAARYRGSPPSASTSRSSPRRSRFSWMSPRAPRRPG